MSKYDTIYKALMSNPDVNIAKITREDHKVKRQGDVILTYGILVVPANNGLYTLQELNSYLTSLEDAIRAVGLEPTHRVNFSEISSNQLIDFSKIISKQLLGLGKLAYDEPAVNEVEVVLRYLRLVNEDFTDIPGLEARPKQTYSGDGLLEAITALAKMKVTNVERAIVKTFLVRTEVSPYPTKAVLERILDGSLKDAKDPYNFLELETLQGYQPRM